MDDKELDRDEIVGNYLNAGDYHRAEIFALSIESEWQKAESLTQVARAWVSAGRLDNARRVWKIAIGTAQACENSLSLQDSYDSSSVLWEIAEDMALEGEIEKARNLAAGIKNESKRERALHNVEEIAAGGQGSFYLLRHRSAL